MKLWTKFATLIKAAVRGTTAPREGAPEEAPPEALPLSADDRAQPLQEDRVADMLRNRLAASEPDAQRDKKGD